MLDLVSSYTPVPFTFIGGASNFSEILSLSRKYPYAVPVWAVHLFLGASTRLCLCSILLLLIGPLGFLVLTVSFSLTGSLSQVVPDSATVIQSLINLLSKIIVFSRDEKKQEDLRIKYCSSKLSFVIGDVREPDSLLMQ